MDYNSEVPFERDVPEYVYNHPKEEAPDPDKTT